MSSILILAEPKSGASLILDLLQQHPDNLNVVHVDVQELVGGKEFEPDSPFIIAPHRRNRVRQAVSFYRDQRGLSWEGFSIDIPSFKETLEWLDRCREFQLSKMPDNCFRLNYETFWPNTQVHMKRLYKYLGMRYHPSSVRTQVGNKRALCQTISNFTEFFEYFKSTKWGEFL